MSGFEKAIKALQEAQESLQLLHCPDAPLGVDLSEQLEATHEALTAVRLLQTTLLRPLAVILSRDATAKQASGAWLQVVTALGVTIRDVWNARPKKPPKPGNSVEECDDKKRLIDLLTNRIDEAIRKGTCTTYDEWQSLIASIITAETA